MIRDLHPADELAMVRADIERLQSREAVLRHRFSGDDFTETVVFKTRRIENAAPPVAMLHHQATLAAHQAR